LDRAYWFIPRQDYRQEQYHRAALHDLFVMLLAYLVSPFLSLGVFLHVLQDSFTTCKDRGCEWFYPISRLVKRGLYDENGHLQHENFDELVCFYQEDPHALVEHADNDLWDEGPSPWRRVYGPAQNSSLLNRGFLYCSIAIIVLWVFMPNVSNLDYLLSITLTRYFILFFWIYFCGDSFPSRRTGPKRPTAQSAQIQLREIPNFRFRAYLVLRLALRVPSRNIGKS
jgi:hypothetical protein